MVERDVLGRVEVQKGMDKAYDNGKFRLTWIHGDSYLKTFGSKISIDRIWTENNGGLIENHRNFVLDMQFCDNKKERYGETATTEDVERVINQFGFTLVD